VEGETNKRKNGLSPDAVSTGERLCVLVVNHGLVCPYQLFKEGRKMRLHTSVIVATVAILLGSCVQADTQTLNVTVDHVQIEQGELVTGPNGGQARVGNLSQASIVNDETGERTAQWCRGNTMLDDAGMPAVQVGFCSIVYDSGDVLWISYLGNAASGENTYTVIGGTGQYEGETGGGGNRVVSQRGDGRSWTSKAEGTVTTP